jgi:CubicO group peptidase (beta-lactamase class C family)
LPYFKKENELAADGEDSMRHTSLRWIILTATVLILAASASTRGIIQNEGDGPEMHRENPEHLNMDSDRLVLIDDLMNRAVDEGVFSGGTVLIARNGSVVYEKSFGYAVRYQDDKKKPASKPVFARNQTVYDIASLTKLFTAAAVMRLADENRIRLDDPVARYLPEFGAAGKERVTIRQLLAHTGGLPASVPLHSMTGTREKRIRAALRVKPVAKPGERVIYSDVGYIVLGELVWRVSGIPLDRYMEQALFEPLGLHDTLFRPPAEWKKRIAATEFQRMQGRGMVWGEVHDENAWSLGGVSGHAGLFSTAEDVAKLGQLLLQEGQWGSARLLRTETAREMTRPQKAAGSNRGLGVELDQEWYMGPFAGQGAFGHTGFTGTSMFVSPRHRLVVVFLTNRVHPVRSSSRELNMVRRKLAEIVHASLRDT